MISIIIPLYNKNQSIIKTVGAVLKQSFTDFELLIVDDGSTDNSLNVVKRFKDGRIRLIAQENGGVSSARNTGIKNAKYEWIAFLDADDHWHKDFLKNVYGIIIKNEIELITTDFEKLDGKGKTIKKFISGVKGKVNFFDVSSSLGWHIVNMSAFCTTKEALLQIGGFNPAISHGEDMEVIEKIAKRGDVYLINKILSFYVQDSENRAMMIKPHPAKTWLYNFNAKTIGNTKENTYYKNRIMTNILNYIKSGNLEYSFILFNKHSTFISPLKFIRFLIKRGFNKF